MKRKIIIVSTLVTILFVGTSFKNNFFEIAKQIEIFTTLFKELNMNYVDETNPAELMDTAIKSMLDDLDPYTNYFNEQDVEAFKINQRGEYSGIGAMVKTTKDHLLIVEPYEGYPADEAGLKAGDEIIKIDDINISDFKDDASDLLKGSENSEAHITYIRQGKTYTTTIVRKGIEIDAVPFYGKLDDKTGYIVLKKFNRKAAAQTKEALEDLKSQGIEKLVLDLRDNPGGLLYEAINICNFFVPKGEVIVTTKSKVKKFNRVYKTRNKPIDTEMPLVILVNGRSASASEIVSGALQDLDRAVIVGGRSFGKGLVQRPINLKYGTQLKVTTSRYYTPSGRCIQALDYWHRDQNGNAVRTNENDYTEYKTKNGRSVYDGGGILPDVETAAATKSDFTLALLNDNVIFDYATNYYYSHNLSNISDFKFTETDYLDFKNYALNASFDFKTKTENRLVNSINKDELSQLGDEVTQKYNALLQSLKNSNKAALESFKVQIENELESEIILRYFYRNGLYTYNLTDDETLITAKNLLKNTKKVKQMLQ